jgi:hypothetical protein
MSLMSVVSNVRSRSTSNSISSISSSSLEDFDILEHFRCLFPLLFEPHAQKENRIRCLKINLA